MQSIESVMYKYVYVIYKKDTGPKSKKDSGEIKRIYYYDMPVEVKPPDEGYGVVGLVTKKRYDQFRHRVEEGSIREIKVRTQFVKSSPRKAGEDSRRLSIVLVSDRLDDQTGFGTQINFLYKGLTAKDHDVHALHFDEADRLLNLRFDWIISLGDYYQVDKLHDMDENFAAKWIHWLPISHEDIDTEFWQRIKKPRHLVAMSRFGLGVLSKQGFSNVTYIPHGIDLSVFRPLLMQEVDNLRMEHGVDKQFIVIFVGRNTKRKRVDHLLTVFAKFIGALNNDAPVKFVLKTEEKYSHISVTEYSHKLDKEFGTNLLDHIMLFSEQMSAKQLNELYNLAHVGISATGGEGFGLTTLECVAAGVPMVIGRHSTSEEILGDTGLAGSLIDIADTVEEHPGSVKVSRAVMDTDQAVDVLLEYYRKWEDDQSPNRVTVKSQVSGRYSVNTMIDMWDGLLADLVLSEEVESNEPVSYRRMTDLGDPISLPEV